MTTINFFVSGIKLLLNKSPVVYNTLSGIFNGKKVDINEFHKILGYCGSDRLKKTAKINNLKLNGEFKTYEQCSIANARQKNLKKTGRVKVKSLESDYTWILVLLRIFQWLIVEFKRNAFNLKVENNRKEYLSCHIIEYKESNEIMILQPHYVW
jgi:hypothetical protein